MRKSLHVKLEPDVHADLFATASDHGVTVSALIEALILESTMDHFVGEAREIMVNRNQYQRNHRRKS